MMVIVDIRVRYVFQSFTSRAYDDSSLTKRLSTREPGTGSVCVYHVIIGCRGRSKIIIHHLHPCPHVLIRLSPSTSILNQVDSALSAEHHFVDTLTVTLHLGNNIYGLFSPAWQLWFIRAFIFPQ